MNNNSSTIAIYANKMIRPLYILANPASNKIALFNIVSETTIGLRLASNLINDGRDSTGKIIFEKNIKTASKEMLAIVDVSSDLNV